MSDQPTGARLGAKIAELFGEASLRARAVAAPAEAAARAQGATAQMEAWETELAGGLTDIFGWLLEVPDKPPALEAFLDRVTKPGHQTDFFYTLIGAVSFGLMAVFQAGEPWVVELVQRMWRANPEKAHSAETAASMARRRIIDRDTATHEARSNGVSPERFAQLYDLARTVPPVGETLTALNRGLLDHDQAKDALRTLGMADTDIDWLLELRLAYPGAADLVRFAIREVFSPEIAGRYGAYEDLPQDFLDNAERSGLGREFATWYWAAHWDLPSYTQGAEMLHRGVIDQPTFSQLLRALDVQPYWRDKLEAISYHPFTRIDIRRMYRMGFIDREEVYRAHRDIGYDHDKATKLTEFTVGEKLETERDLTKAEVIALFERHALTEAKARDFIRDLGYTDDEVSLILTLSRVRRDRAKMERSATVVRSRFVAYRIDEPEASAAMDRLGFSAEERNELIRLWRNERELNEPDLTRTDLVRFAKKGILDFDTFVAEMKAKGYNDTQIEWIIQDAS